MSFEQTLLPSTHTCRMNYFYEPKLPLEQRGASLRIDCPADMLLLSLWDKTASGTQMNSIRAAEKKYWLALDLNWLPSAIFLIYQKA